MSASGSRLEADQSVDGFVIEFDVVITGGGNEGLTTRQAVHAGDPLAIQGEQEAHSLRQTDL